jgi:hypothetical protein
MSGQRNAAIPEPVALRFSAGIRHPELWLWDSWLCERDGVLHLYCLALNRKDSLGVAIAPAERNYFNFHVRRFTSDDCGATWLDRGCFLKPASADNCADARNVWSGSAAILPDGRCLFAYTGVRALAANRAFLQTLCAAACDAPDRFASSPAKALSCPLRDYDLIIAAGYYLGPRDKLGGNDGEDGGPILAWRDPFVFVDERKIVNLFWSAKTGPSTPALGHATLIESSAGFRIDALSSPIALPDAGRFTQAEVPKIYRDARTGQYLLLIAACDRLFEGQPDAEVSKVQRLYVGPSALGPWRPYNGGDSLLAGLDKLFGASVLRIEDGELKIVAPYTEQAEASLQLTFAPLRTLKWARPTGERAQFA